MQLRYAVGRGCERAGDRHPLVATSLRVTMNNFLAFGGDGFTVFNEGTDALGGAQDIDAFADYLGAADAAGLAVPALDRITAVS